MDDMKQSLERVVPDEDQKLAEQVIAGRRTRSGYSDQPYVSDVIAQRLAGAVLKSVSWPTRDQIAHSILDAVPMRLSITEAGVIADAILALRARASLPHEMDQK